MLGVNDEIFELGKSWGDLCKGISRMARGSCSCRRSAKQEASRRGGYDAVSPRGECYRLAGRKLMDRSIISNLQKIIVLPI